MRITVSEEITDMILCRSKGRLWFGIEGYMKMDPGFSLPLGFECRISDLCKGFREIREI